MSLPKDWEQRLEKACISGASNSAGGLNKPHLVILAKKAGLLHTGTRGQLADLVWAHYAPKPKGKRPKQKPEPEAGPADAGHELRTIRIGPESDMVLELTNLLRGFRSLCEYKGKVITRRRKDKEWQETEDDPSALSYIALSRLFPGADPVYTETERVFITAIQDEKPIGFIAGVLNAQSIHNHVKLESYDNVKYGTVVDEFSIVREHGLPLAWIEILCVSPDSRKKGIVNELIGKFEEIAKEYAVHTIPDLEGAKKADAGYVFVGIDTSGTKSGGINVKLKTLYERHGYDFGSDVNQELLAFGGAQFGSKFVALT